MTRTASPPDPTRVLSCDPHPYSLMSCYQTATLIFASLHKCVESLREDPTFDIPPDIKRLRQANFKVEYKSRTARGIHVPLVKGNGKKPRGRPPKPASQKKRVRNRETPSPSSESGEESGGHETGGGVDEEEEEEVNNE